MIYERTHAKLAQQLNSPSPKTKRKTQTVISDAASYLVAFANLDDQIFL